MQIRIIKPGLLSTVQDMGRHLHLSQAVPVSGAMDTLSARLANIALGNDDNAAVIEFTYANAKFEATTDLLTAWAGDGAVLKSTGKLMPAARPVFIPAGTVVDLVSNPIGARTCLAVAGGWDVPMVLGSRSTFLTAAFGGMGGRALQANDVLSSDPEITPLTLEIFDSLKGDSIKYSSWKLLRESLLPADRKVIRVVPGREFNWFNGRSIVDFLSTSYTIGLKTNRMGYQLEGATITRLREDELLSTAVTPGTIQVTGNGSMILLMADCQTTGGYPRIAQIAAADLPLCAQMKPGDSISFKEITIAEAENWYIEQEKQLLRLVSAVKNKFL